MATVFERLQLYCTHQQKELLGHQQKTNLGRKIIKRYFYLNYNENQFAHYKSDEPEGSYKVINYPDSFTPEIDILIAAEYLALEKPTPPKKRKRIPVKSGPEAVFQVKPTSTLQEGQTKGQS